MMWISCLLQDFPCYPGAGFSISQCMVVVLQLVTTLRSKDNFNYYLFSDYAFYTGRTFPRKVSNRHFSTTVASMDKVSRFIAAPTADFACINDVDMAEDKYMLFRGRLLDAFEAAFPEKSRFEL